MMFSRQQTRIWVAVAVIGVGAFTAASLRSAGGEPYSGKEWAAPGGDWASTRYSTLAQINARNIKQLGGAWVVGTPDRAEATPMVKDGRMFVVTTAGIIRAITPATSCATSGGSAVRGTATTSAPATATKRSAISTTTVTSGPVSDDARVTSHDRGRATT